MNIENFFTEQLAEHQRVAQAVLQTLAKPFAQLVEASVGCLERGGKIIFCGNGGSAADAQHLATEFTVRYINNRRALAALALTTDSSALTAIGNDLGFEMLFARQLEALGKAGDILIAISTSGRSPNIIHALQAARAQRLVTALFTGGKENPAAALADISLAVPSVTTARIQEMHIMLGQMLVGAVEQTMGLA